MTGIVDDMKIPVGELCQVKFGEEKCFSAFRGICLPEYALMDLPMANGKLIYVPPETEFQARFTQDGIVYGFKSAIVKIYTKPFPICVISYPPEIKSVNLRKSKRITTLLPSKLETDKGTIPGAIVDLSEGGGLFSTFAADQGNPKAGGSGFLHSQLPTGKMVDKLPASICSVKKAGGKTLIGLRFENNGTDSFNTLKSFYDACALSLF